MVLKDCTEKENPLLGLVSEPSVRSETALTVVTVN